MRNQVQLIAYADRLGGSLAGLHRVLQGPLAGLFGGVHVLPFYRPYDGADAGFDPADHTEVDPRLGTWADLGRLGESLETVADLIVNHVSTDAAEFQDFLARGDASPSAGMFLTFGRVFGDGATEADLLRIYRPRPGLPFTPVIVRDGGRRLLWTTFTSRQVDLDVRSRRTRRYLFDVLQRLAGHGVAMVRLDAVGYAVKTAGTTCFMTPDTLAFVDELADRARQLGVEVLAELHSHHRRQIEIGRHVDWVYDFALPPLVLHALFTGDARRLRRWLDIRPHNAVTVLDTHDGIGVVDVGADQTDRHPAGLLEPDEIDALVRRIHANSGGTSRPATGQTAANVDLYQVNATFYDALGRDDQRYLLARLLQFFAPGIPQVYYVGLLAGGNDLELLARTGVGREINRHRYTAAELDEALDRPVVRALARLIRFRNAHPAFQGAFSCLDAADGALALRWRNGAEEARVTAELATGTYTLSYTADGAERSVSDVADLPPRWADSTLEAGRE
jgi:sucrose phosphorylase